MRNHFKGELAEWSIAAVLKTVDCNRSGGSNPSLSALIRRSFVYNGLRIFYYELVKDSKFYFQ